VIPYAEQLAEMIDPAAVRLRRDFGAILSLIRAHAILHQAKRRRDDDGRLIAGIEDYGVVHELVADLVGEGVEASVPDGVRRVVRAVEQLTAEEDAFPTAVAVARHLGLDKATTWRWIQVALARNHLKNLEHRRGRPARLAVDDPLPKKSLLPALDILADAVVSRFRRPKDNQP
jgi:hypothetical protein